MDCDRAMIEYLYDLAPARCTCARLAVGMFEVCNVYADFKLIGFAQSVYQSILAS
jgi:hypothetical protein